MKIITKEILVDMIKRNQLANGRTQARQAEAMGIAPAYLSDVYHGRREPGQAVAKFFGLKPQVVYVEIK